MRFLAVVLLTGIAASARAQAGSTLDVLSDSSACLRADAVGGDSAASRPGPTQRARPDTSRPAILLRASASAREVRFASTPHIRIRLCGGVMDSVRVLERRNLPEPVQPGRIYRNVYVAVEILGHLNARCIAERLGAAADSTAVDCASLTLRDTTSAARRRPPP